jgi:hypothetical protein
VALYRASGVAIGLGTDWLPSGSMNMLRELACAAELNDSFMGGAFTDHELWQMATIGAARALAFDDAIGLLIPGHAGDVAVFRNHGQKHFGAVVRASLADVALVLRGGKVLSGDSAVVAALESGCDEIDVCGSPKALCVSRDTGKALAEVESAAKPIYPLFFCDTPTNEPSCLPARTLTEDSVVGSSLYSGISSDADRDGDGIKNDEDNCASLFNPIRPVDLGKQGDADGDGLGDPCDPCPLADGDSCSVPNPYDSDGDGLETWRDNCPSKANMGQQDSDGDGHGDDCDECPNDANPGSSKCPGKTTTIFAIQDPSHAEHPAEGTRVEVECVITAVSSKSVWCQDEQGGAFSGIMIYVGKVATYGDAMAVAVGDRVKVQGDYQEYQGTTELAAPEFAFVAQGSVPAPIEVAAAAIATGGRFADQYQGVLVRVTGVTVINADPDAPNDYDELIVTGNLRIDDLAFDGGAKGGAFDNANYPTNTSFSSVTGIVHYSFMNSKLLPRTAADLVS